MSAELERFCQSFLKLRSMRVPLEVVGLSLGILNRLDQGAGNIYATNADREVIPREPGSRCGIRLSQLGELAASATRDTASSPAGPASEPRRAARLGMNPAQSAPECSHR